MFISFEGIDGSGKSTIIDIVAKKLESRDYNVLISREPGGSIVSEKIRDILLFEDMDPKTEMLLFAASRREHVAKVIAPAIHNPEVDFLLCDRYIDSSVVYQGIGRDLSPTTVYNLNKEYATGNYIPNLTFYIDIEVNLGLKRCKKRNKNNRLDCENIEFYEKIRRGYIDMVDRFADRMVYIDGNREIGEIVDDVMRWIDKRL